MVTGCDHGLGLHLARELPKRGYFAIACYLRDMPAELEEEHPGSVRLLRLDIGSDESVRQARDSVATYMRGYLDTTAKITPAESAAGILKNVLDGSYPV